MGAHNDQPYITFEKRRHAQAKNVISVKVYVNDAEYDGVTAVLFVCSVLYKHLDKLLHIYVARARTHTYIHIHTLYTDAYSRAMCIMRE